MKRTLLSLLVPLVLAPLSAAATDAQPAPLVAVPAALALGERTPGSSTEAILWLVNDSDTPLELLGARGDCGCVTVPDLEPRTLAAGEALSLTVRVVAPAEDGRDKATRLVLATSRGERSVPVSVAARSSAAACAAPAPARHDAGELLVVAERLAFDGLAAGQETAAELWLVNPGREELELEHLAGSCGCLRADAHLPARLAPGRALRVPLVLRGAREAREHEERRLQVRLADGRTCLVPVTVTTLAAPADRPTEGLASAERADA